MDYLAKNIAYLRGQRELGQTALAKVAGVDQATISRIEAGKTATVKHVPVMRLARYFGQSVDDLVGRDLAVEGPSSQSQPVEIDPDSMASALVVFDQAMRHFRVDYSEIHRMADVLIFAYEFRHSLGPTMTKEQFKLFDKTVLMKMEGTLNGAGIGRPTGEAGRESPRRPRKGTASKEAS